MEEKITVFEKKMR